MAVLSPTARLAVRQAMRLALEHHPLCSNFQSDRLRVGRVQLCSGCAVAGPAALLGLALAVLALTGWGVQSLPLAAASLAMGLPQLATYLRRGSRAERAVAKGLGGLGIGSFSAAALVLPFPWTVRIVLLAVLAAAFVALQAVRLGSILATCRACPFGARWGDCPGFNLDVPDTLQA